MVLWRCDHQGLLRETFAIDIFLASSKSLLDAGHPKLRPRNPINLLIKNVIHLERHRTQMIHRINKRLHRIILQRAHHYLFLLIIFVRHLKILCSGVQLRPQLLQILETIRENQALLHRELIESRCLQPAGGRGRRW